jgi:lysophospholipase L1-like esterase
VPRGFTVPVVKMASKIALNLCAVLFGVVLSVVLLETALRIYNPIIQTVKGYKVVLRTNYDETWKWHIRGVAPDIRFHKNSLGFRGADPPAGLAERLSIITIGGSTTHQASQSDNLTWTALLGDSVAECFDRTWINNAGFEGHSSFGHIQLIRGYIDKLHPKIAVLLIGANELYWTGGITEPNRYDIVQLRSDLNFHWGIEGFLKGLSNRSEVVDLGLTLYRSFVALRYGSHFGVDWTNLAEGDTMPPAAQAALVAMRDKQPAYATRLRYIIHLLRDGQTVPVLLTQPTVTGIGQDPTTGKDLARLLEGLYWYQVLEIYNDTMRHVAETENVYVIDLAQTMPKDTKYYWDRIHYTDAGSKKVAQLVAKGILPYLRQQFPSYSRGTCEITSANPGLIGEKSNNGVFPFSASGSR